MLDTLKSLALKHASPSGNLSLTMLPFTNMRANVVYDEFETIIPRDDWKVWQIGFCEFYIYTLDVKVSKDAGPIERIFSLLWEHRNDTLAARWELYSTVYNDTWYNAFRAAYDATRDRTFDTTEDLSAAPGDDADPERLPASTPPAAT